VLPALASARRAVAIVGGVAVVAVAALLAAPDARAATCWERVITDWRDGRITGTYSSACLRTALKNLPEDLRVYGSAEEDITRALARAVEAKPHRVLAATATRTRAAPARPKRTPTAAKPKLAAKKPARALARARASSKPTVVAAPPTAADDGGTSLAPARTAIAAGALGLVSLVAAAGLWRARRRRARRAL
jgi:hypothetical protein